MKFFIKRIHICTVNTMLPVEKCIFFLLRSVNKYSYRTGVSLEAGYRRSTAAQRCLSPPVTKPNIQESSSCNIK